MRHTLTLATLLLLASPALAETAAERDARTHREIQNGINRVSPAQPPQAGPGKDINKFQGYQGQPHNYNRPYNVPSPGTGSVDKSTNTAPGARQPSGGGGGGGGTGSVDKSTTTPRGSTSSSSSSSSTTTTKK